MTTRAGTQPPDSSRAAGKIQAGQQQSLNHLLNFSLPPRQVQAVPRRSRKYGTQHGIWNKERFVNAQYRFVMDPTGDYTVHFADPDIYFQWQDILQVIIPRLSALASAAGSSEAEGHTTCPICLSPPVAPRMTKCGHVYCFPCLLHLISTADNKWVRCPICFDSINEFQLKAVKWYDAPLATEDDSLELLNGAAPEASSSSSVTAGGDLDASGAPRAGSTLRLRLMQRPQITTLALPRSRTWPSDLLPPHQAPWHFLPDVAAFARFMLATPTQLLQDLSADLDALAAERASLAGMADDLGLVFVDAAAQKVRGQMERAAAFETAPLRDAVDRARRDQVEIEQRTENQLRRQAEEARRPRATVLEDASEVPEALLAAQGRPPAPRAASGGRNNPRPRRNLNPPPPSTQTYYYYQSASGAPVFLHPLDIKILLGHFGSYAAFPDAVAVRVEASAAGSVDDGLRKRCKYLAHLPDGADVVFVEADLEGVVGADGLRAFEAPLRTRRTRRREKGRRDDRARAKAEERRTADLSDAFAGLGSGWSGGHHVVTAPPLERGMLHLEEFPAPDVTGAEHAAALASPPASGAWGARSFASALHAPSGAGRPRVSAAQRAREEAEWDVDGAWDDLEQAIASGGGGGGGRKKRGTRMVVLGGGGGGGRRR